MSGASLLTHSPALSQPVADGVELRAVASQHAALRLQVHTLAVHDGQPFHAGRLDLLQDRARDSWSHAAVRGWDTVRGPAAPLDAATFAQALGRLALAVEAAHLEGQGRMEGQGREGRTLYAVSDGRICRLRGDAYEPLCNFVATIRREVLIDDGAAEHGELEIAGLLDTGQPLASARVPLAQFARMDWVLAQWGTRARVRAGLGSRDQLREAIQALSPDVRRAHLHGHTGWCRLAEGWGWLHAGGTTGGSGAQGGAEVALGGALHLVRLPEPPAGVELAAAIGASLSMLDVAPDAIAVPLLAAAYRAPLAEVLPVDVSVYLVGQSGTFKSELTVLAQAHYGAGFTRLTLPAQWASTANALERLAFEAKDCLLVIDDFAPHGAPLEVARLHATAERVFRGAGNRAGRGRMAADGSMRPDYPPRGLLLASGEDVPAGHSLAARLVVVQVAPGDVRVAALTQAQREAGEGLYAAALAGYLAWLAPQLDALRVALPGRLAALRAQLGGWHAHRRTPDALASLLIAWELWVRYAAEAGALRERAAADLPQRVRAALLATGTAQATLGAEQSPAEQFIALLGAAIAGQRAHLVTPQGGCPDHPGRWGWRPVQCAAWDPDARRTVEQVGWAVAPGSRLVGWVGPGEQVYLQPEGAYAAAQGLASEKREGLAVGEKTLWKRLHDAGMLASVDAADGKNLIRRTIGEQRRYVLHVHADLLGGHHLRRTGVSGVPGPGQLRQSRRDGRRPLFPGPLPPGHRLFRGRGSGRIRA